MARKKILSLSDLPTGIEIRDKLAAQGIRVEPYKGISLPVAYRDGRRRKVSSCTLTQLEPTCGCCCPSVEIVRNRDDRTVVVALGKAY